MHKRILPVLLALLLCGCAAVTPDMTAAPTVQTTAPTVVSSIETTAQTQAYAQQTDFNPYAIVQTMSNAELVGQLFLGRFPDKQKAIDDAKQLHLGGYILFGKDFEQETPASVADTIRDCQSASAIPLFIAVDEEGGSVCRVSSYPQYRLERFSSPRKLYESGGMESVLAAEGEKSRLLSSLGININMAPVCDITTDPSAFMYSRSLGQDPLTTGQFAADAANVMAKNGIGAVLKHFPGYGNNADTHIGIAVDERPLEELEQNDLVPFRLAVKEENAAILVSHTIIASLDSELPASLSPRVITYLRRSMGFDGVVVTDDLVMQAITDRYGAGESAIMAIAAGCDLLCSSQYELQYTAVLDAVDSGRLSRHRVIEAAARVLQLKHQLGLISES